MTHLYTLNLRGEPMPCDDVLTWAKWFESAERHVAYDLVGDSCISTVFLGMDHSFGGKKPILWETMVFRDKKWCELMKRVFSIERECERFTSREAAVAHHEACVQRLRAVYERAN